MIKKLAAVVGTLTVVAVAGLFVVGTAFAQTTTPPAGDTAQAPWSGAWGRVCSGAGVVSDAISELLGMTHDEIYAERQAGKTLADLAEEKGITDEQLLDAMAAGHQATIDQAVLDGRLTQEQAEWMTERMEAMAPFMLDNPMMSGRGRSGFADPGTTPMLRGGMRGGMRGGGMHGFAVPQAQQ